VPDLVAMVADPVASYEPISLLPLPSVMTLARPFITPWVVSEPTPANWRNWGGPLGSACAGPAAVTPPTRI
jgi:hypothetical protein